jgi:uncharacterized protein
MYVDLTDVLRSPGNRIEKPIKIAPTTLDDVEIVEPVEGLVRVENARQSIVVGGNATTAITLQCARCLEPYAQELDLELEADAPLSFLRPDPEAGQADEEDEADDDLAALFDGHMLNVSELVRQAAVLQSPIKPLCSPDCPGLPEAANYVAGRDERWSSLQDWNK